MKNHIYSSLTTPSGARSLEKALDILYSFDPHTPEQSLLEISRKLQFPASTTRRILKVLATGRLIEQDPNSSRYRLGPGIHYLSSISQNSLDIRRVALPAMERLRNLSGESVTLYELRGRTRVCIEKVDSQEVVREIILVGNQFPAHCGASGKVLLAYLDEQSLLDFFRGGPLEALTPKTITDPRLLRKELKRIKSQGYALSTGERVLDGLCAISSPVWDHRGKVNYSLTLSVPVFRLAAKGRERLIKLVKETAQEISAWLGSNSIKKIPTRAIVKRHAAGH
jgi:DNA-binding IclR family transcriptional regulator